MSYKQASKKRFISTGYALIVCSSASKSSIQSDSLNIKYNKIMVIFNQQKYPKSYLGNTKFTVARWGCLVTVITMIYDYIFNKQMTPDITAKKLEFLKTGELVWKSLNNVNLKLVSRVRKKDLLSINSAFKNPKNFVAIQVNNNHWVWLIGRYIPFLGYRIVDPFHGDKCYTKRYRNNITGHAVITKA